MAGLFVVIFGETPYLDSLSVNLGLASSALISAAAQIAFLVGLWLTWTAFRPRR